MKKIAITQRLSENNTYPETRDALDVRWGQLFEQVGLLPVILPSHFDSKIFFSEMQIDGLILSGGNDLSIYTTDKNSVLRDNIEKDLLDLCIQKKIPVMGICRGMQLITQHMGGALMKKEGHVGNAHEIAVCENSRFYNCLNTQHKVNSYHNYAVVKTPPGFIPSALAIDGSIEAMEHEQHAVFAQMWHPERNEPLRKSDLNLIKYFFNA